MVAPGKVWRRDQISLRHYDLILSLGSAKENKCRELITLRQWNTDDERKWRKYVLLEHVDEIEVCRFEAVACVDQHAYPLQ